MKLGSLTKKQKEILLLASLIGFGVVWCLNKMSVVPLFDKINAAQAEAQDFENNYLLAKRILKNEMQIRMDFDESVMLLDQISNRYLPAKDNPLVWVSQRMYYIADKLDVDLEYVVTTSTKVDLALSRHCHADYTSYPVLVSARCSFADGLQFLRLVEKSNPFVCISEVSFLTNRVTPQSHEFRFVADFPIQVSDKPGLQLTQLKNPPGK